MIWTGSSILRSRPSSRSQLSALGGGRDRPLLHETMAPMSLLLLLLLLLLGLGGGAAHCPDDPWCPSTANCTVNWYNQTIGERWHTCAAAA